MVACSITNHQDNRQYSERHLQIMEALWYELDTFDPLLAEFVDPIIEETEDIYGADWTEEGLAFFNRVLYKNGNYFATYHITVDLNNMEITSTTLETKKHSQHLEEWESFKRVNEVSE